MHHNPHLFVALSGHGFGHIAQTGPVVNALRRCRPALRLTIHCPAEPAVLREHFSGDFEQIREEVDPAMAMDDALGVRIEESHRAYAAFFRHWNRLLDREADRLHRLRPDLLLANVPFLSIAAAARTGVPAVALCSLNWADIYRPLCGHAPGAEHHYRQMAQAYNLAECFLQPAPSMAMPAISRPIAIGPIARLGMDRRTELRGLPGCGDTQRLLLLSLGGIPTDIDLGRLPRLPQTTWLVPGATTSPRADVIPLAELGLPYIDVLRSVDCLITKPGYGSFAEAGVNGIPVLSLRRPRWPEAPALIHWLQAHGRCLEMDRDDLFDRKRLASRLDTLASLSAKPPPAPTGITDAAARLRALLPDSE